MKLSNYLKAIIYQRLLLLMRTRQLPVAFMKI